MTGKVRAIWTWLKGTLPPHQSDVRDRFDKLDPLVEPELADRMRHGEKLRRQPRSFEEWQRKHGRKVS